MRSSTQLGSAILDRIADPKLPRIGLSADATAERPMRMRCGKERIVMQLNASRRLLVCSCSSPWRCCWHRIRHERSLRTIHDKVSCVFLFAEALSPVRRALRGRTESRPRWTASSSIRRIQPAGHPVQRAIRLSRQSRQQREDHEHEPLGDNHLRFTGQRASAESSSGADSSR